MPHIYFIFYKKKKKTDDVVRHLFNSFDWFFIRDEIREMRLPFEHQIFNVIEIEKCTI